MTEIISFEKEHKEVSLKYDLLYSREKILRYSEMYILTVLVLLYLSLDVVHCRIMLIPLLY